MIGPVLRFATIVLVAQTPLSIAGGDDDKMFDMVLARDASGLPTIPATSLKGVLRGLYQAAHGEEATRKVFGYIDAGTDAGQAARLDMSWGVAHGADDRPARMTAPAGESEIRADELLEDLCLAARETPILRRRTKINSLGAASARERGQFDRSLVPAGTHFSIQIAMSCDKEDDESVWRNVLSLFLHPSLRIGGATRAGLGRIVVAHDKVGPRIEEAVYDLRKKEGAVAFAADRKELFNLRKASQSKRVSGLTAPENDCTASWTVEIEAESFWRIGGGLAAVSKSVKEIDAKARILTEPVVDWTQEKPGVSWTARRIVVPGAGVKGALRHRTAFHYARLTKAFIAVAASADHRYADTCEAVTALFGHVRPSDDEKLQGARGRIVIDDVIIALPDAPHVGRLAHNSIDRFTGGVRDHLLFDEEALFEGKLTLTIRVEKAPTPDKNEETYLKALRLAVEDLKRGWLTLGAGSRSGHGAFRKTTTEQTV